MHCKASVTHKMETVTESMFDNIRKRNYVIAKVGYPMLYVALCTPVCTLVWTNYCIYHYNSSAFGIAVHIMWVAHNICQQTRTQGIQWARDRGMGGDVWVTHRHLFKVSMESPNTCATVNENNISTRRKVDSATMASSSGL